MCVRELATAKQSQDKPALSRVPETSRRIWLNQDATSAAQSQDKQLRLQAPRSQRFGCLHVLIISRYVWQRRHLTRYS